MANINWEDICKDILNETENPISFCKKNKISLSSFYKQFKKQHGIFFSDFLKINNFHRKAWNTKKIDWDKIDDMILSKKSLKEIAKEIKISSDALGKIFIRNKKQYFTDYQQKLLGNYRRYHG